MTTKDDAVKTAVNRFTRKYRYIHHESELLQEVITAAEQRGREAVLVRMVEALQMTWCAPDQLGVQMVCDQIERNDIDMRDLEVQLATLQTKQKTLVVAADAGKRLAWTVRRLNTDLVPVTLKNELESYDAACQAALGATAGQGGVRWYPEPPEVRELREQEIARAADREEDTDGE
jgi:hypothetical protein